MKSVVTRSRGVSAASGPPPPPPPTSAIDKPPPLPMKHWACK